MYMVNKRKGSFTIELACLMPLILLILIGCIYLCLYVHNRSWLTAAAYESAIIGSREMLVKDGTPQAAAYARGKLLLTPRLFGAENLNMTAETESKKVIVQFDADTIASYGGLSWHLTVRGQAKAIDPVSFIWTARGFQGIADALRNQGQ